MPRKITLTHIIGKSRDIAFDLNSLHFSELKPFHSWTPDVNVYRYDSKFEIWVDLAGVSEEEIQLNLYQDSIRITGERQAPLPNCEKIGNCKEVLIMEIENGRFMRDISLPEGIDLNKVSVNQYNGMLCIVVHIK